jgi:hypothetical protein
MDLVVSKPAKITVEAFGHPPGKFTEVRRIRVAAAWGFGLVARIAEICVRC